MSGVEALGSLSPFLLCEPSFSVRASSSQKILFWESLCGRDAASPRVLLLRPLPPDGLSSARFPFTFSGVALFSPPSLEGRHAQPRPRT